MIKIIKRLLMSNNTIRNRRYFRLFKIDKKTKLGNVVISVSKAQNLIFCNNLIGSKNIGSNPVSIMLKHNAKLIFDDMAFVREGVRFQMEGNSECRIGHKSYFNPNSVISAGGKAKINIGSNCAIAWNVNLLAYDYHCFISNEIDSNYYGNIIIGNHVWIGANVTILKNVSIGENCVVAANSVVGSGDYPPNSLIAGVPAKIVKNKVNWRNLSTIEKIGNNE